jgi:penicillin-binding protein 1A
MYSMMQDVIRGGTGARAMALGRADLAGKTGTTNDQMDAWFAGFQRHLTAVVWVGFDLPRSLGPNETGAVAALPIWISYLGAALKNAPEESPAVPVGVTCTKINPETGLRQPEGSKDGMMECFYQENIPPEGESTQEAGAGSLPTQPGAQAPRRPEDAKSDLY